MSKTIDQNNVKNKGLRKEWAQCGYGYAGRRGATKMAYGKFVRCRQKRELNQEILESTCSEPILGYDKAARLVEELLYWEKLMEYYDAVEEAEQAQYWLDIPEQDRELVARLEAELPF